MSFITDLFGGKKKKAPFIPPPLPPIPVREDPEVARDLEKARKEAAVRARVRGGRSKTILTSGLGLPDDEDDIKRAGARKAKLLGG